MMVEKPLIAVYFMFRSYLDQSKPLPVTILGVSLALWHHATQGWLAVADSCPHRLAPLSEGRVVNGGTQLACSYHGWKFDDKGKCTVIPQVSVCGQFQITEAGLSVGGFCFSQVLQYKLGWFIHIPGQGHKSDSLRTKAFLGRTAFSLHLQF